MENEISQLVQQELLKLLKPKASEVTVDEYIETFKQSKVNCSPNHQAKIKYALKWFSKHLGKRQISSISRNDCQNIVNTLVAEKAQETCKTYKATFVELFNLALIDGLIQSNPFTAIKLPRRQSQQPRQASLEDIRKLLKVSNTHRLWFVPILEYLAGLRREEVCGLDKSDITIKKDIVFFNINKAYVCESGKCRLKEPKTQDSNRVVIIKNAGFAARFKEYLENLESEHIMPQQRNPEKRTSPDVFTKRVFDVWQKKAGINIKGQHTLRHAFAYNAVSTGMDIELLRQLMGHSDTTQTLKYAKNRSLNARSLQTIYKVSEVLSTILPKNEAKEA